MRQAAIFIKTKCLPNSAREIIGYRTQQQVTWYDEEYRQAVIEKLSAYPVQQLTTNWREGYQHCDRAHTKLIKQANVQK